MTEQGFVCLYRVSTRQQEDAYGLDWQRRALRPFGEQHLGPCLGEYDEGATSTGVPFEQRPVLQELLTDLETFRPGYLLVADQDRIARGDDFALVKRELRRLQVRIAFYREAGPPEVLDLDDEYGDFTSDIFSAVAKLEKRRITKRMRRGKEEAARAGNAVMPVPYGYWKPAKGKVAIDEDKAYWVREIYERLATGEWTIRRLALWLHQEGAPPPRGRAGHWSTSYLARLIKNPAFTGHAQMMGVEVPFPPIVTEELFELAQAMVRRNYELSGRNNKRFNYLLRGLIRCGRCGGAVVGRPRHDKPAYCCNGHPDAELIGKPKCTQPRLYAHEIETAVWHEVEKLIANPDLIRDWAHSKPALIASEAIFLRRRLGRYSERRERLLRQHEHGHINDTELKTRLEEIEHERADDEQRLDRLPGSTTAAGEVDARRLQEAEKLCREIGPRLRLLTFDERRYLIERLVRRVTLDGRAISVEVVVPAPRSRQAVQFETA